jgi:hypothetical protein
MEVPAVKPLTDRTPRGSSMNARNKLNSAYMSGSLVVAGVIGWLAGSWAMFGIALAVLLTMNVLGGNIRNNRKP